MKQQRVYAVNMKGSQGRFNRLYIKAKNKKEAIRIAKKKEPYLKIKEVWWWNRGGYIEL